MVGDSPMITFVLYALSVILNEAVPGTVYWLTGLVDGVLFIPLLSLVLVPLAGRVGREKIGRLHYLQAAFPMNGVVLVLTPWGYEFAALRTRVTEGGETDDYAQLADGSEVDFADDQTWYRLGNRKFSITYLPDPQVLNDVHVEPEGIDIETVIVEDDEGQEQQAWAIFGDRGVLKKVRGGFRGWTPFTDPDDPPEGFIVSLSRAINSLRGGGGVRLSEHTEKHTRMEYGGGTSLSNRARAAAFIGVIFIASVLGILIFGVFG